MPYNPDIHHRRSIRLKNYDYTRAGLYFVTICTQNRECLFGEIVEAGSKPAQTGSNKITLNPLGIIIQKTWFDLIHHNKNIKLHDFIVMPNHVHGIIEITPSDRNWAGLEPAPTSTKLTEIIRQFKTFSAKRVNQWRKTVGVPVWQRNYHEHIIRHEATYLKIAEYIQTNPQKWLDDRYYQVINHSLDSQNYPLDSQVHTLPPPQ
ncbi:MAG: transposase [Gammaproteobacteria bacterium]|nr:transposase [Gammaproteobacteria bacterium]